MKGKITETMRRTLLEHCQGYLSPLGIRLSLDDQSGENYNYQDITGRFRGADITVVRAMICKTLYYMGYGCTVIGAVLNRDHATALHLIRVSEKYPEWSETLEKSVVPNTKMSKIEYHRKELERLESQYPRHS